MEHAENQACRPDRTPPRNEVPSDQESIMRHALITIHLLDQARDTGIAQADADQRLEHQAAAMPRIQPAQTGRLARVLTLARRVRALAARTT